MYLESDRVCVCVCLSDGMHIEVRGQPSGVLFLFSPWVLGIRFGSSVLAANTYNPLPGRPYSFQIYSGRCCFNIAVSSVVSSRNANLPLPAVPLGESPTEPRKASMYLQWGL